MVGRASWAEGLQQGLQEGDMTQGLEAETSIPGVWQGEGSGTESPGRGTGGEGAQVGSPAENGGESRRGSGAQWEDRGCLEDGGLLWGTFADRYQVGNQESLSWEEAGREGGEDERNVQELRSP